MREAKIINGIFQINEFPDSPSKDPYPTILMLHGFTGNHLEPSFLFSRFSREASKRGYATVRFDFRGSGNSEKEFYEMTSETELEDSLEIIKIMKDNPALNMKKLFVLGLSMGGTIALRLVGKVPNLFKGCILWSAASYNKEIFSQSFNSTKDSIIRTDHGYDIGGLELSQEFMEEIVSYNAINEIGSFNGPFLLIHGSSDTVVPLEISKRAHSQLPNSELHIIKGADHTYKSVKWSKEVFEITLDFLDKQLGS